MSSSERRAEPEEFSLRTFCELLVAAGEMDVIDEHLELVEVEHKLAGNPRAVWMKSCGPEGAEVVGNVMGSRRRLAMALGVPERELLPAVTRRRQAPVAPTIVSSDEAACQQVVRTGADVDLLALPVHLQHVDDAAPYLSAPIDVVRKRRTADMWNVGCRRLMLRGRQETGIDLNAPSDLRVIYQENVAMGERTPIAFAVGSHPADFIAATMMADQDQDELALMGAVRGTSVSVVRGVTVDVLVPADAEYVIEGYIEPDGYVENEGPYGEYLGYYGGVKKNPVVRVTAITSRRNPLFQTVTIGGRDVGTTDTSQLAALRTEATLWAALCAAVRRPVDIYVTPSSGGMFNCRIAMETTYPGEPRNAIAAAFASTANVKNVFVVDPDLDVRSDKDLDWALATRFQADRDVVIGSGFRGIPIDPSMAGRTTAKCGFDLTWGHLDAPGVPEPPGPQRPVPDAHPPTPQHIAELLDGRSMTFFELMRACGSRDGRELVRALEELRRTGAVHLDSAGKYTYTAGDNHHEI